MTKSVRILTAPGYNPGRLFNAVRRKFDLASDRELAEALGYARTQISHMRGEYMAISSAVMVAIMDITGWTLEEVRSLGGIPRPDYPMLVKDIRRNAA